jgi:hypothetical protein
MYVAELASAGAVNWLLFDDAFDITGGRQELPKAIGSRRASTIRMAANILSCIGVCARPAPRKNRVLKRNALPLRASVSSKSAKSASAEALRRHFKEERVVRREKDLSTPTNLDADCGRDEVLSPLSPTKWLLNFSNINISAVSFWPLPGSDLTAD